MPKRTENSPPKTQIPMPCGLSIFEMYSTAGMKDETGIPLPSQDFNYRGPAANITHYLEANPTVEATWTVLQGLYNAGKTQELAPKRILRVAYVAAALPCFLVNRIARPIAPDHIPGFASGLMRVGLGIRGLFERNSLDPMNRSSGLQDSPTGELNRFCTTLNPDKDSSNLFHNAVPDFDALAEFGNGLRLFREIMAHLRNTASETREEIDKGKKEWDSRLHASTIALWYQQRLSNSALARSPSHAPEIDNDHLARLAS